MGPERRIHPRLEIELGGQMRLVHAEEPVEVTVSNLSVSGAAVESDVGPEPGERVSSLRFDLPAVNAGNGEPERVALDLEARVSRRIMVAPRPGEEPGYILGLEFQGLDESMRRLIHRFVFQKMMDRSSKESVEDPSERVTRVPYRQPITLSYDWFGDFETQLTENLSVDGMFIRSSEPYPPGTVFDFQLLLRDDFTLVKGRGEVVWIREKEGGPTLPAGMGIRFLELDEAGRNVIQRVVSHHAREEAKTRESGRHDDTDLSGVIVQKHQDLPPVQVADEAAPSPADSAEDTGLQGSQEEHLRSRFDDPSPYPEMVKRLVTSETRLKQTVEELSRRIVELEERLAAAESPGAQSAAEPESPAEPEPPEEPTAVDEPEPVLFTESIEYGSASRRGERRWLRLLVPVVLIAALTVWIAIRGGLPVSEAPRPADQLEQPVRAAAGTVDRPSSRESEIISFVESWAAAWAASSTDEYLAFYSPDFETPTGLAPQEWESYRRDRVESVGDIEIQLDEFEVELDPAGQAEVTFLQTYSRPGFSDQSRKRLVLTPIPGGWSIIAEQSLD